jgi:hypothetical protein
LALLTSAACTSVTGSPVSGGTDGGGDGGPAGTASWSGDPCSLLGDADFAKLSTVRSIGSKDSNNVGSTMFSPECHFSLQGNGSSAAVGVFVDKTSDFALQKSIFQGTAVTGLGKGAWRGNAGGQGNSTIDVLLDKRSFRVDATYEYSYADLTILATAIAGRLQ